MRTRGRTSIFFGAALLLLLASGCGISAIAAGVVLATQGGGSSGGGVNTAPSVVITTSFPPGLILRDTVTIDFVVSDAEGNPVSLLAEVSQDSGVTWIPALNITGVVIGLPATAVGLATSLDWDTYADVGSTFQNDVRFRLTPFDPKQGQEETTGILTVDNTHRPDVYEIDDDSTMATPIIASLPAQVHSIHRQDDRDYVSINVTSTTVLDRFTIETSNLTGGDTTIMLYDTDGISELAENDDKPGGGLGSRIDFVFSTAGVYYAEVSDPLGGFLYTYELTLVTVASTAPSAMVLTPTGAVFGGVTISYVLTDPDGNPATILVDYSENGGVSFFPATEIPGGASEGTTGLSTSSAGETHQYVWDSSFDIGSTDQTDIQIRITPSDPAPGTASTSSSFHVDNVAPTLASAEYDDLDNNGPDRGDTLLLDFSEDVVLGSQSPAAYTLPVSQDTLGDPLTIIIYAGPASNQVTIELGDDPVLTMAGVFDALQVLPGSPSGIDVAASLPPNAITDIAGNEAVDGMPIGLDGEGVDVASPDTTPPFLLSATAQALSGVSNDEVQVVFNEPVIPAQAADLARYALESPSGSAVDMGTSIVTYDPTVHRATIQLTDTGAQADNLQFGGSFRISVTGISDIAGNTITPGSSVAGNVGGDGAKPMLTTVSKNDLIGPDVVDFLFDEAMDPLTANDPIHFTASGGIMALSATLLSSFQQVRVVFASTIIAGSTVDVSNVRDLAGNTIDPVTGRGVSGSDSIPPGLSGFVVTANEGLANDSVSIQFDEPVDAADAANLANFALESPIGTVVDMTGSSITYSGTTLITLTGTGPAADNLQFGNTARIIVDNVRDLAGNPISPGSSLDTTVGGDNQRPSVVIVLQNLSADSFGATVDVQFTEALDTVSAETVSNYSSSGGITAVSATLTPGADLVQVVLSAPVTSGFHTFSVSGVLDAAGNPMFGVPGRDILSTDSTPPVAAITSPPPGGDVSQAVDVLGTASDDHSTITAIRVNGTAATSSDGYATWTAAITLNLGNQLITVETEDFNGNADPIAAQITVNVQGNTPPKATVPTPSGVQIGDVPINYNLIDADNDLVTIQADYSTDGGSAFFTATESTNPLSEGLSGLSASLDPGTPHLFIWDSLADGVGVSAAATTVRFRITPSDAVVGTPGLTGNFTVNNANDTAPFIVRAVFEDPEADGLGIGDRITLIFNEPVSLGVVAPPPFVLPVPGDTFGTLPLTMIGTAPDEIVVTLGSFPNLTIPGRFIAPISGMPSGIDIPGSPMAGAIVDAAGNDAVPTSSMWSGGAGVDGAFDSAIYTTGDIDGITKTGSTVLIDTDEPGHGGTYEFTTFSIASTDILIATGANPVVIRATGDVTIDGTIALTGFSGADSGTGLLRGAGGAGSASGGNGGIGGRSNGASGLPGGGPGGGGGGITGASLAGGGGGGATFATAGAQGADGPGGNGGRPGTPYGDPYMFPLRGGSGAGGGGGVEVLAGGGAGGGGGGGAIRISSDGNVTVNGTIEANGGAGGDSNGTAAAGGASGGSIHIQARGNLTVNGAITASGGPGGIAQAPGVSHGGPGGDGRIRLEDSDGVIAGSGVFDPAPSTGAATVDISGGFRSTTLLPELRMEHSAIRLRDGTVLITGGRRGPMDIGGMDAVIYDPVAETFLVPGPVVDSFHARTSTLLPGGDVLITGGYDSLQAPQSAAEIYSVSSGTFSATMLPMTTPRGGHTATLLPDGLVLLAGGGTDSVEVYDWVLDQFTLLAARMTDSRTGHTATVMADGGVLLAGGEDGSGPLLSTDIFDFFLQSFSIGPNLSIARAYHTASLVPNGDILLAGGEGAGGQLRSAEFYDPASGTIIPLFDMLAEPRTRVGDAVRLPDGRVLIPGGGWRTADIYDPWTRMFDLVEPFLKAPRTEHTVTHLPDGSVLIAGGFNPVSRSALDQVEIFRLEPPLNWMTINPAGDPGLPRGAPSGTLLWDGRVLVAGGNQAGTVDTTLLYDPAFDTFNPGNPMGDPREAHRAILLPTGDVLVVGGTGDLPNAELYNPSSGSWTPTPPLNDARSLPDAILLWTGDVLVCGGVFMGIPINTAEIFQTSTSSFVSVGDMTTARVAHSLETLPDGRILVTGGWVSLITSLDSAEIYDPVAAGFASTMFNMSTPRQGHTSTLLPGGRVLIAGGSPTPLVAAVLSTELFELDSEMFSAGPNLSVERVGHSATLLPNGTVMIAGGMISSPSGMEQASVDIYSPLRNAIFPIDPMGAPRSVFPLVLLGDGRVLSVGAGAGADLYTP
ncbi:MAG: hypothetical protein O7H41_11690 [Planctomycetota bacterium]|nr:hypothetical protein [Planctomycetota bacterium]